jgi:hypothetical protein
MNVDRETATQWFRGLDAHDRAAFLANLAHNLTVAARAYYKPQTTEVADPNRLRTMNELQHRITSYLGHLLGGTEDISWAPFIVEVMLGADDPSIAEGARWAWQSAGGKGIAV